MSEQPSMLNENIKELARQLGEAVRENLIVLRLNRAKEAYDGNSVLRAKVTEYNVQKHILNEELGREVQDRELINSVEDRVRELYAEILADPCMAQYSEAEAAVNAFLNEVNGEITRHITGETGCSSDKCASCGGCAGRGGK